MEQRIIKFRGKRIDNGEWVYGYYASWEYEKFGGDSPQDSIGHFIFQLDRREEDDFFQVIPETVGQFTGLKDKNEVEIYEGDIMMVLDRDWPSGTGDPQIHMRNIASICEVVFHNSCFQLLERKGKGYYNWDLAQNHGRDLFEVIGNIYTHSHLLKSEDKTVKQ